MKQADYLIAGQGIAGSLLAWFLWKSGKSFYLFDPGQPSTSSGIAAGILHPVTGRRIVKTWMAETLFPFAEEIYRELEIFFSEKIFHPVPVLELLQTPGEFNEWMARSEALEFAGIEELADNGHYREILQPFYKALSIRRSGWVDVQVLLSRIRNFFLEKDCLVNDRLEPDEIHFTSTGIRYREYNAAKVIFCDGAEGKLNPWWGNLPFLPAKGELLTFECDAALNHILNRRNFIVQTGKGAFKSGSTFSWQFANADPTPEARKQLEIYIRSILKIPFSVTGHLAAIRPTVQNRRPFLGLHPEHPQIGIFNGLGTKGCLLAPWFAHAMAGFLENKNTLIPEVDVSGRIS